MNDNEIMRDLNNYSIEELEKLSETATSRKNKKLNMLITNIINEKRLENFSKELNEKFDFNKFNVIPPTEKDILDYNNISNLQQLIDADLNKLTDLQDFPIGENVVEYLDWARKAYDMKSLVNIDDLNRQNESKKLIKRNTKLYK